MRPHGYFSSLLPACNGSGGGATLDGKDATAWRADLEDPARRDAALRRLAGAGDEARPVLVALLEVPRGQAPVVAAQMLAEHGAAAVPPLRTALAARSHSVRIAAAAALGLIGADATDALPALRGLRDSRAADHLKIAACVGIWGITQEASEVMPTMIEGLRSGTPEVVFAATGLAALVGPKAVRPLMVALESDDPALRVGAAEALAASAPTRRPPSASSRPCSTTANRGSAPRRRERSGRSASTRALDSS